MQPIKQREISAQERKQILSQIDRVISEGRSREGKDLYAVRAEKRGALFPLVINLAAAVLIAVGVFLLFQYFGLRRESITLRRSGYLTAEMRLIETLKQESESQLQAKDNEIASIQMQLRQVKEERQMLEEGLEAELSAKEQELRARMAAELKAEQQRLAALGTSDSAITDKLRELERRQEESFSREIERYREQLDTQLKDKEQKLIESEQKAQEALAAANREREALLAEQESRFEEQKQALERKSSLAERRLQDLTARIQQQNLFEDQIMALYGRVRENLEADRYAGALSGLTDLETLLRGVSVEESSYLEKRTDVETFLVAALKELVQMKKAGSSAAVAAAEEQGSYPEGTSAGTDTSEQLQAEIEDLKKQLADQTEEVDALRDQLRRRIEASDSEADSRLLISQLQEEIDSLRSQLGESEGKVDRLAARLAESEAANRSLETQVGSLRTEIGTTRLKAVEEGRDNALGDVMTFLNYLSGSGQKGTQAEQSLLAQARKDPLYRAVTREIQILIAGGSSAGDLAVPYRFLGTVSSVSAGKLIIEAMVDLRVAEKALVQIRRISDLERELTIAEGEVQQILGSKITAAYRLTGSSGQSPAARDLVYIEVE